MAQALAQPVVAVALCLAAVSCQLQLAPTNPPAAAGAAAGAAAIGGTAAQAGSAGAVAQAGAAGGPGSADAGQGPTCDTESRGSSFAGVYLRWQLRRGAETNFFSQGYDGWAEISRSTADELDLLVNMPALPDPNGADAGISDAPVGAHCVIEATGSLPVLPVGKRVWLSESDGTDFTRPEFFRGLSNGRTLAVSTSEGGVLIVGGASVASASVVIGKTVSLGAPNVVCSWPGAQCQEHGSEIAYSLSVTPGSNLRVTEGSMVEITSRGVSYAVSLLSARKQVGSGPLVCADALLDNRMWITAQVLPRDPASIDLDL